MNRYKPYDEEYSHLWLFLAEPPTTPTPIEFLRTLALHEWIVYRRIIKDKTRKPKRGP